MSLTPVQRLKIALMTEGMALSEGAREALSGGAAHRPLTLADYASTSGISMELAGGVWVNAPIADFNPNFVSAPSSRLDFHNGIYLLSWRDVTTPVRPVPVPSYHDEQNERGEPYTSFAITHTDRVRISPVEGCALTCQFCDLPYKYRYRKKPIESLVDSVARAQRDAWLPARHVLISGGTPRPEDYGYLNEVYAAVAGAVPALPVDVMMAPMPGLLDPAVLRANGVHGLSVNMELNDESRARRIMHGKWRLGRRAFLDFIERAVDVFGLGRVRSLLMVGIEPVEETLKGVEALAQRGCDPVLSPFRPDPATPLRRESTPAADLLAETYLRALEIVGRLNVVLGPRCIPCQHNTLTFPDDSGAYYCS